MVTELTREHVGLVARTLIKANGQTTTLEVKNFLRELGFWIGQLDVRNLMLDLTGNNAEFVYRESGNGYRIYTLRESAPEQVTADIESDDNIAVINAASYINSIDLSTVAPITQFLHRDNIPARYEVTNEYYGAIRVYDNVTRSQAKARWAAETGDLYRFARTRKLS
jgi:hypothetical protein